MGGEEEVATMAPAVSAQEIEQLRPDAVNTNESSVHDESAVASTGNGPLNPDEATQGAKGNSVTKSADVTPPIPISSDSLGEKGSAQNGAGEGSEQDRERKAHASKRVEQGRQWNKRERNQNTDKFSGKGKKQNKFDPTSQKETNDPKEIRKQVEFYFSDSNLMTDNFLFKKVDGHNNLPVPLEIIHSFKRMRRFQPRSAVVEALKGSQSLSVVDNDSAIQRKIPLSDELVGKPMEELQKVHESASMARSVYVKGFGAEESQTQFDIEAFFANYGPTNSVRLRRQESGLFKGSVFVEFDAESTAKTFLSLDPKPKWKGTELLIKSKKEYCDDKVEDIKAGKIRRNSPHRSGRGGRNASNKSKLGKRRVDDEQDWRERRNEDNQKGNSTSASEKRHNPKDSPKDEDKTSQAQEENQTEPQISVPPLSNQAVLPDTELSTQAPEVDKSIGAETSSATKKRSLPDDGEAESQGQEKKVDTKET